MQPFDKIDYKHSRFRRFNLIYFHVNVCLQWYHSVEKYQSFNNSSITSIIIVNHSILPRVNRSNLFINRYTFNEYILEVMCPFFYRQPLTILPQRFLPHGKFRKLTWTQGINYCVSCGLLTNVFNYRKKRLHPSCNWKSSIIFSVKILARGWRLARL